MYKQIETDKIAYNDNGSSFKPVATLASESGGKCQISIDDHCYVVKLLGHGFETKEVMYNLNKLGLKEYYKPTTHIFQEALEILRTLPNLRQP